MHPGMPHGSACGKGLLGDGDGQAERSSEPAGVAKNASGEWCTRAIRHVPSGSARTGSRCCCPSAFSAQSKFPHVLGLSWTSSPGSGSFSPPPKKAVWSSHFAPELKHFRSPVSLYLSQQPPTRRITGG